MGSLQEQLLKMGLVSAEQLEQSRKKPKPSKNSGKRAKKFQARGNRNAGAGRDGGAAAQRHKHPSAERGAGAVKREGEVSLEAAYRARQALERKEQETDKQRQQREQEARRQRNLKLDAIVKDRILNTSDADIRRYFEYGGRIRHLYVTQEQLQALADGQLGVVVLRGRYLLVEPEVLAAFKAVAADLVPDISGEEPAADGEKDVPDDLRW